MFKVLFILTAILIVSATSFAQSVNPDLLGKKISLAIKQEQQLKSEIYTNDEDIIIAGGMAIPVRFIRVEKDIPNLIVQYIFSEKDSIIRKIEYEWDVRNFDKSDHNVKPLAFNKALIERYNNLVTFFTKKYGAGAIKGDLSDLTKIEALGGLTRTDKWNNGHVDVLMYTTISNHYEATAYGASIPTHRIRVYLSEPRK
jgi:hypothetical protein